MQETGYTPIFENNCMGISMKIVAPGQSNLVFICGEYYGRYEDDDFSCLVYDLEKHKFYTDSWTTRGDCSTKVFDKFYVSVNFATTD